jgi:cold shock CspA family protein
MNSYRGGGGQRRGSGASRRGSRQPSNIHNAPFEQGIICSLKESFGFIHCAERPEEIFFHYSEVVNYHPDDLQVDTEVEFKVGASSGGDNKKLAAYSVHRLETGTVVWETEENEGHFYQGLVDKPCLPSRGSHHGDFNGGRGGNSGPQTDGLIRIMVPEGINDDDGENESGEAKKSNSKKKNDGSVVRLRAGEFSGAKAENNESSISSINSNNVPFRLFRGDLVAFRIFLDKRTKQNYARHITLLQTERERKRVEKEKKMLENASAEEGIVISLNNGFGFIKSNRRREDVYFHYSQLTIPETDEDGNKNDDFELKKGQELKFLVVTETNNNKKSSDGSNGDVKVSARQIHCLPKGSVVFHTVELKGVKGIVVRAPHPPSPGSKNDDSKWGRVRLMELDEEKQPDGALKSKEGIMLHFSDAPGGVFTYQNHRNQPMSALWIHEGDTLLFDVAKETVDGSYRIIPTFHKVGLGGSVIEPDADASDVETPAVRLLSVSMVGRAEGVIHALKPDYGFIHFAERPVDVHFKTYDLMPYELQADIRKNMGIDEPCLLEEEAAVQFDICAHGNITTTAQRGRRRGAQQARENIRGQRLVLLPKSAVVLEKVVTKSAKGVIKSINPQQLYTGSIDMEEAVTPMTMDERHPIVAKMISSFLEESSSPTGRKSIVFRDTLGMGDDDVIIEMATTKGLGVLECSHIPVPGIAPHPGRICIRRIEKKENDGNEEVGDEGNEEAPKDDGNAGRKDKKKAKDKNRNPKVLRFDKSSLDEALKDDIPPSIGDVITCDVIQNRRTGKILVKNLKIVERNVGDGTDLEPKATDSTGLGVVKDVVTRRHFGFISVYDENNSKNEMLFFHLPKDKRFVKGNEVEFDIAMEGSKRIAINVENVRKGTIPSAASKNACLGYVLMEPSHTTLSNTPLRKAAKGGSDKIGNGRWAEGNDDKKTNLKSEMVEDGCILLLEDKAGMFQRNSRRRRKKKRSDSVDSADTQGDLSVDGAKSVGSDDGFSTDDGLTSDDQVDNGIVTILSRLNYKNGSIAIHGTGATSSMDGSTNPKRGDLVSFIKGRKARTARDIRIVKREAAFLQRGRLETIRVIDTEDKKNKGKAQFIAGTQNQEVYDIDLAEVVSCAASILKEKESVEGILHEGKVYGLCRTSDLYLKSKLFGGSGKNRERPKLNLTVKKDRGGKIMAQSMMAKGPDGSNGFKAGWTTRVSLYATNDESETEQKDESDEIIENASGVEGETES